VLVILVLVVVMVLVMVMIGMIHFLSMYVNTESVHQK
jgi:hypothetical protein